MEVKTIKELYPLEFLQWIEIPRDDKNAEVIFQMFVPAEISRQEALSFWELRQRAFEELSHHDFSDMVRAAASFSKTEADIAKEASKRKVDISEAQIAYKELQERYEKILVWQREALEEKAKQEKIEEKERKERQSQKQKVLDEKLQSEMKSIGQTRYKTQDKNAVQRGQITHQINQKEEELDEFTRLNHHFEDNCEAVLSGSHAILGNAEALMSQSKGNPHQEQSLFLEAQHSLSSYANRQNATFEEIGRKTKNKREEQLENLYQERNKLEW